MELDFLLSPLVCVLLALLVARSDAAAAEADGDWDDVVVTMPGRPASLPCADWSARGAVAVNWMRRSPGADEWKPLLSANERKAFSGGASKPSMRLADANFQETGNFSLILVPEMEDAGQYSCLVKQKETKLKERVILLAILTVTIAPTPPVPQRSTLRLMARVSPASAVSRITWVSPRGAALLSESLREPGSAVAKLPQVLSQDNGSYVCVVHPAGRHASPFYAFNVQASVDAWKVASFRNVTHGSQTSTACLVNSSLPISCPPVPGDYVLLYRQLPDSRKPKDMRLVFQYDRWRGSSQQGEARLRLAGPPYEPKAGGYGFLLSPGLEDGGLYICEVFLNDNVFSQRTMLSVLKVHVSHSPSALVLWCRYSELSQVKRAGWTFQNQSLKLTQGAPYPGSVTVTLPLPHTPDAAGNYTCTLLLNNGRTARAVYTVSLPPKGSIGVATPSLPLLPALSALLLLVPLVAAAAGVLLWRQGNISRRGIEQSLSHHSGEAENIYENPEDLRQGSVYMDLKPRGEDDVYKELDRYEQCQI